MFVVFTETCCLKHCFSTFSYQDFAGLQSKSQCFCGNDPGAHSFSESCDMDCEAQEASNCYDGSSSCTCGGVLANDLFRTSASVSCPEVATDSYTYIGCFEDDANRVFDTLAIRDLVIPSCVALCREMGFGTFAKILTDINSLNLDCAHSFLPSFFYSFCRSPRWNRMLLR